MAISFVTRFRRHLAAVPFVIVFLIPLGVVAVYFSKEGEREDRIGPVEPAPHIRPVCVDGEPLMPHERACPEPEQGAE